jgi:hypothetical protein
MLLLGPKFSVKQRKQISLRRFYAISQIEYCRNFIFERHFPIHKTFRTSLDAFPVNFPGALQGQGLCGASASMSRSVSGRSRFSLWYLTAASRKATRGRDRPFFASRI